MGSQVFDKGFNFVMAVLKGILWVTAAVVYGITLFVNGRGSGILEIAFCFGVIFLGLLLGVLNIRKIPRLYREFKDIRAENAAYKAARKAAKDSGAPAKTEKDAKTSDWPDLHN